MAFQNFHRWGERNYDEIHQVMRGTNYPTSFVEKSAVTSGETVFNETFEGTMGFVENPKAGQGNKGTFIDPTMSIIDTDSSLFARRWVQCSNSNNNSVQYGKTISNPGGSPESGEKAIGFTWTWNVDTDDLSPIQVSGCCYAAIDGGATGTFNQRYPAYASSTTGDIDLSSSAFVSGTFAISVTDAPYNGYCTVRINATESW